MEMIKDDEFRKLLKKGVSGGFLFYGDEDYMKSFTVKSARSAVCPDETFAIFNDVRIDALDYSPAALLDALIPPPMMTEQKIVTVSGLNVAGMRQNEIDELCEVLRELKQYDYNLLIISAPAGQFDEGYLPKKPSAAYTKLTEYLTPVKFDPVSEAKLISWVGKHFEHNGAHATPEVCAKLIKYCGRSMFILSEETEKLSFYVLWNGRNEVTSEDIKNVAVAEMTTGTFALANAICDGRNEDAMKALEVLRFRRADPINILFEVSKTACEMLYVKDMQTEGASVGEMVAAINAINKPSKISEYKVRTYVASVSGKPVRKLRRAVELCAEADALLKSTPLGYVAIERLICSL